MRYFIIYTFITNNDGGTSLEGFLVEKDHYNVRARLITNNLDVNAMANTLAGVDQNVLEVVCIDDLYQPTLIRLALKSLRGFSI
jgi:hypothetical protein